MKTKLLIGSVVILLAGAAIGAWGTYSYGQELIMKNLPIGTAVWMKKTPILRQLQTTKL